MRQTSAFIEALAAQPSRPVLNTDGETVTAGEILRQASRIAELLDGRSLGEKDVAVLVVPPGATFLAIVFGTMMAGTTLALLDPEMGPDNYRAKISQLQPAIAFVDTRLLLLQEHPVAYAVARRWAGLPFVPRIAGTVLAGVGGWMPIIRRHIPVRRWLNDGSPETRLSTVAGQRTGDFLIVYTSGTADQPRGVVLSLQALGESVRQLARLLGQSDDQRIATHLPQYMLLGITANIPVFTWNLRWSPEKKLRFIHQHRITTLFGPPADFLPLIAHLERNGQIFPGSVRVILLGSAPVYPGFLTRLRSVISPHIRVVCIYGMTENLLVASASLDEKLAYTEEGDFVGRPLDGVEVRLAPDHELLMRSPQCYTRYLHEQQRSDWHATGDLARLRDDGAIVLLGRKKDMIIRGNFNLYPALYEPTVCRIDGVGAAAFVGIYDDARADETVCLFIEPSEDWSRGDETLRRRVAAALRNGDCAIDRQALPDEIVVTQLPRAGRSRKIDKQALRERLRNRM